MPEVTPTTPTPKKGLPPVVIAVIVVLVLLGVGGFVIQNFVLGRLGKFAVEKAIESKTGAKVNLGENGSLKVENKEGALEIGSAAKWPSDMPSDVPQFTFGTITASVKTNNESGKAWSVIAKDVEKSNFDSYVKELESNGWVSKSSISSVVEINQLEKGNNTLSLSYDASSKGLTLVLEVK